MQTMDTILYQSLFLCLTVFIVFMVFPTAFYYCYQMWELKEETFFERRMPKLSIACVVIGAVQFLFQTIAYLPNVFDSFPQNRFWIMYGSGMVFVAEVIRVWFMYFNYVYNLQSISKEWGDAISFATDEHWAINKNWYSAQTNTLYYMGAAWVLLETSLSILFICIDQSPLWASVPSFIVLLIAAQLAFKIKSCRDDLHIQEEFKFHGANAIFLLCAIISTDLLIDAGYTQMAVLLRMAFYTIFFSFFSYISTKWLLIKHKQRKKRSKLVTQNSNEAEMKDTLEKIGFNLFALHLIKEHSVQHLLFVLEVSKLKAQCFKHGFLDKADLGKYLEVRDILKRVDSEVFDTESFFRNAKHIIDKYVDWEGEYAVNISSNTRRNVLAAFEELSEWRDDLNIHREKDEDTMSSTTTPPMTNRISKNPELDLEAVEQFSTVAANKNDDEFKRRKSVIGKMMAVVDTGMQDVWHLLENDSFARFRCSKQFHDHQMNCNAANTSNMPW